MAGNGSEELINLNCAVRFNESPFQLAVTAALLYKLAHCETEDQSTPDSP